MLIRRKYDCEEFCVIKPDWDVAINGKVNGNNDHEISVRYQNIHFTILSFTD